MIRWFAETIGRPESITDKYVRGTRRAPSGFYEDAARVLGVPVEQIRPPAEAPQAEQEAAA